MRRVLLLVVTALLLVAAAFFGVRFFLSNQKGATAGLKVTSTPTTSVFLDSRNIGRTPYEEKLEPGEYTLKLIPEITGGQAVSWQGKIKLSPNLLTFVNRELNTNELTSGGEILTLEKTNGNTSEIAVLSTPEGASVQLDSVDRGAAPLILRNIEPGDHELSLSAPGFLSRSMKIRTTKGFKLTADIQLGLGQGSAPSSASATLTPEPTGTSKETKKSTPSSTDPQKPFAKILETPTGWLRVRMEPSTSASESGKVDPGKKFTILEEKSGWYRIEYEKGKEGWISSRYAQKVE